jgi:hypothetical protein
VGARVSGIGGLYAEYFQRDQYRLQAVLANSRAIETVEHNVATPARKAIAASRHISATIDYGTGWALLSSKSSASTWNFSIRYRCVPQHTAITQPSSR